MRQKCYCVHMHPPSISKITPHTRVWNPKAINGHNELLETCYGHYFLCTSFHSLYSIVGELSYCQESVLKLDFPLALSQINVQQGKGNLHLIMISVSQRYQSVHNSLLKGKTFLSLTNNTDSKSMGEYILTWRKSNDISLPHFTVVYNYQD